MTFFDCNELTELAKMAGKNEKEFKAELNKVLVDQGILLENESDDFIGLTVEYCVSQSVVFTWAKLGGILWRLGIENTHRNCVKLGAIRLKGEGDCPECGATMDDFDEDIVQEKETGAYVGWVEYRCPRCGEIVRKYL